MKPPRLVLTAVAATTLFALTGCAPTGDVAVEVDHITYSGKDVDALVDFQCAQASAQQQDPSAPAQKVALATARHEMASRLYDSAVYRLVGEKVGVQADQNQIGQDLAGLPAAVEAVVPAKDRQRVIDLITETYVSASMFSAALVKTYGEEALNQLDQQGILDVVAELRRTVTDSADIELDPAYGVSKDGAATDIESSLSLPVSAFAKDSTATEAPAAWVEGLPANQVCG